MADPSQRNYVVVARRYRPQTFEDLVGQEQVGRAMRNAIATGRVGHAYLFTGARGVGKTSTARILAKALNCQQGPTATPCNECDICQSISVGGDVDVLEIDGASNRGIDEIRQLRSNVGVRPSRSRYKIYIIDEVHMLTVPAFNALLKTLEEPPEHVKFIFCTTDPEKVPITVLSRCQRFDFAPVGQQEIVQRLTEIVQNEGVTADEEALQVLARRAAGSMRDSQSLLEQLLSYCGGQITADDVYQMLGAARGAALAEITSKLIERDAAGALDTASAALAQGVDAGQLAEQLLGYFRDLMTTAVGGRADLLLHAMPSEHGELKALGERAGLSTLLAAAQILDQTIVRMRQSPHTRVLLEMALIRICQLEQLDQISQLAAQLQSGKPLTIAGSPSAGRPAGQTSAQKKTAELSLNPQRDDPSASAMPAQGTSEAASQPGGGASLHAGSVSRVWAQAMSTIEGITSDYGRQASAVKLVGPQQLEVSFSTNLAKDHCEKPERRKQIEAALAETVGAPVRVQFHWLQGAADAKGQAAPPKLTRQQRMRQIQENPLVKQVMEMFDGEIVR
jgi:DNA polymerase III subunit gamma/tau